MWQRLLGVADIGRTFRAPQPVMHRRQEGLISQNRVEETFSVPSGRVLISPYWAEYSLRLSEIASRQKKTRAGRESAREFHFSTMRRRTTRGMRRILQNQVDFMPGAALWTSRKPVCSGPSTWTVNAA